MAIPNRPTVDSQVSAGHPPVPDFETVWARLGRRGLDLVHPLDEIHPEALSRMLNVRSTYGGPLEVRPGQTALATTTGTQRIHSLVRLNDPATSSFTRLAGSNTDLYRGQSGALTIIDSGYSGDPLTFAAASARLTGVPYMFIGDRLRNRKVARTGAVAPIGVSAPTVAATANVAADNRTAICGFDSIDGSQAASWTLTAGTDTAGAATGAPTALDTAGAVGAVRFTTNPAGAGAGLGYFSTVSITRTINLNRLQGLYDATDDDMMHFFLGVDRPDRLEEIRIYFVVSAFTVGIEPGTSLTANTDAYFKAFRPDNLTTYLDLRGVPASQSVASVGDAVRDRELREEFKIDRGRGDNPAERARALLSQEQRTLARKAIVPLSLGRRTMTETGVVGYPLRRGDFLRIGSDETRTWGTVTGLVIVLRTNTNQAITLDADDWDMTGGGGPDTTDPAAVPYDFRYTNYDPATGDESNPSPIMAELTWVESVRAPLNAVPWVAGIAAMRQRFYRRGGTLADDWYFDGVNSSDGGTYQTYKSDAEIATAGTLEIDHYQPVPSTNSSGATVLAQPVPIFFVIGEYMFALGDPNQPGRLYRSKRAVPDQFPADGYLDVCPHSDELMNGGEWATGGYVFSRTRLYAILLAPTGDWTTDPTGCTEGLVGRWAMAVTPYGIAFVSPYGVRLTTGGAPELLSDEMLEPLFRGETVRGMAPPDFTVPTALQLAYLDDELWFTYQDTGGARRQLIYNFHDKAWRPYSFAEPVATVYGEPVQGAAASILLGGNATGQVYTHSGFNDDGAGIAFQARTGAQDFGEPRLEKLLGEILLDADFTTALTVQAFLNNELTSVASQAVTGTAGQRRYSFEPFGTGPQHARSLSADLSGTASTSVRPSFNQIGASRQFQPAVTINLPSPWEELPGGEGYVWGCLITCDTGNTSRTVLVEYTTNNGSITQAASLTVLADGRKKLPFTWSPVLAQQIRLRPTGTCVPWIRFKIEWLSDPEPPRLAGWDSNWEDFGTLADKWMKGILIEADTFNVAKTVVLDADQSLAAVALGSLTFNGRTVQHLSFAKVRGRLWRLRATDANGGKLYRWQPIFDEEPLAITRWQTQERPHEGMAGRWQKPLEGLITLRSSGTVTLQITTYGAAGVALNTSTYPIATTGGVKAKVRVPLNAAKGLLFEYLFTAATAFWLYREESELLVEDWASGEARWLPLPASNDDLDPPRAMGNAVSAASTPGGA